jgi:ribose 5-phosphate isomerase B
VINYGYPGAGNDLIFSMATEIALSAANPSTFIIQWTSWNRFDKLLEDDSWNNTIQNDKKYSHAVYEIDNKKWWLSSGSTQLHHYHTHYQQQKQRQLFDIYHMVLLANFLKQKGHEIVNHGTDTFDSVDYPDFGHLVAIDVATGKADFGVVICGSGNGINMTVNKHQGIRSALCWDREIASLARQHNDANIISIPARFTSIQQAVEMVDTFLNTNFEGGRHATRVNKIACQ